MLNTIWDFILISPIINGLVVFYKLTGSLGFSIILLTVVMRLILYPVMSPSIKNMKKQRDLQPELDKLKAKYGYDKKKLAELQLELFKKNGLNPTSGCLTQVVMIFVLIALYQVISKFAIGADINSINTHLYLDWLKLDVSNPISTQFLYLNLAKPDPFFILAVLSGAFQFLQSKMTMPYAEQAGKAAEKTPDKSDDMAYNMQQQMLYTMPIMNFVIGISLPAGVVLYMIAATLFSIAQTYLISGLGGLTPWVKKLKLDALLRKIDKK